MIAARSGNGRRSRERRSDLAGDRAQRHRLVGPFALDELQSSRNDVLGQAAALTSSIALVPWQRIAALPFGSDLDDRLGLLILHGSLLYNR